MLPVDTAVTVSLLSKRLRSIFHSILRINPPKALSGHQTYVLTVKCSAARCLEALKRKAPVFVWFGFDAWIVKKKKKIILAHCLCYA